MRLRTVLWIKIAVTAGLWCVPLLLFPSGWFVALGFPRPEPMLFVRLLGVAYLALGVGYVRGLRELDRGGTAGHAVAVGIVSNGLACAVLLAYAVLGAFAGWGFWARVHLWASVAATGLITLGLFASRGRTGGAADP